MWLSPLLHEGLVWSSETHEYHGAGAQERIQRERHQAKSSSTRQSDWRVRLPTMTHTTGKDSSLLLPLTLSPPFSLPHTERRLFYHRRCNLSHQWQRLFVSVWYIWKSYDEVSPPFAVSYFKVSEIPTLPFLARWFILLRRAGSLWCKDTQVQRKLCYWR